MYNIVVSVLPELWPFRYAARDLTTYNPNEDSTWHLVGYGKTLEEATNDLMQQIREVEDGCD